MPKLDYLFFIHPVLLRDFEENIAKLSVMFLIKYSCDIVKSVHTYNNLYNTEQGCRVVAQGLGQQFPGTSMAL